MHASLCSQLLLADVVAYATAAEPAAPRPHIISILADDPGWPRQRGIDLQYGPLPGEIDDSTHTAHGVGDAVLFPSSARVIEVQP